MAISERKMKIVIDNYFKDECDVDMSIRQAFEKGFRLGVQKALTSQPEIVRCKDCKYRGGLSGFYCDNMEKTVGIDSFCSWAERRTDGV